MECEGYGVRGNQRRGSAVVGLTARLGWLAGVVVAGAFASFGGACSSPAAPLQAGSQCLMTTDCVAGLVCVPPQGAAAGASKICSSNVSSVVSTEDAATPTKGDGAAGDAAQGDGPSGDGKMAASDAPQSLYDTGAPKDSAGGGTPEAGEEAGATEAGE